MDKNALSTWGTIICVVIILAILIGFATPFGKFIVVSIKNSVNKIDQAADDVQNSDGNNNEEETASHEHHYVEERAEPRYLEQIATCKNSAIYYHSCSCGAQGTTTFEYGTTNPNKHVGGIITQYEWLDSTHHTVKTICGGCGALLSSYTEVHTDDGSGTCPDCGGSLHVHNYIVEKAEEGYLASEATCVSPATYYYSCSCGAKGTETFEHGEVDADNHTGSTTTEYAQLNDTHHTTTITCDSCAGTISSNPEVHEYVSSGTCIKCGYTQTLAAPSISLDGDILTITDESNANAEYEVYVDGELATTTTSKTVDLSELDLEYGDYEITVKAKADGYNTSEESNSVTYTIAKSIYGLYETGSNYTTQLKSWDELIGEGILKANGAVVSGKEAELAGDLMLPNTITEITYSAYANCTALTGVQFSNSVTLVRNNAFQNCSNISDVYFSGTIEDWCKITFNINGNPCYTGANLYFNGTLATDITIPNTITSISNHAFIGCTSLTSVDIPSSVTKIGQYAFNKCSNITNVTIAEGLQSVGMLAFSQCTNLKTVYYNGSIESWCNVSFDNDGSNPCCNGASLYINGVLASDVVIADETTEIKKHAFDGCTSITSVTLSSSVTSVGKSAFRNCSNLAEISVNSGVSSFGASAFHNCSKLKTVRYDGTVEQWCGITFGDRNGNPLNAGATFYIGGSVLTDITIPATVSKINDHAFTGYVDLERLTIAENVTSIGENAFYGCTSLNTVTIPASMVSFGKQAFYNCTALTNVYYEGTLEQWCEITFADNNSNPCRYKANLYFDGSLVENITIPSSITAIKDNAFVGCASLKSVVISEGTTSIGAYAFYSCTNLSSITIPTSVTSVGTSFFAMNIALNDIYYNGTTSQWNAITFASNWDKDAYACTVHCTNEDIELS